MPKKGDSTASVPRTGRLSRSAIAGMAVARAGLAHLGHKAQSLTRDDAQQAEARKAHEAELGRILFAALNQLKGTALKASQLLGTELGFLPEGVRQELARAHYQVTPLNRAVVVKVLRQEFDQKYGHDGQALFQHFEPQAFAAASLISLSRVYLGYHFPSDVAAGAVLGAALGAAAYGLLASGERRPAARRWLLWPQLALVAVVTQMAYMGLLPRQLLTWPGVDKVLHFSMFGLAAFWLHQWLTAGAGRSARRWPLPGLALLAASVLLPFSLAAIEEYLQRLSPLRTFDLTDLASDLAGMLVFAALSAALLKLERPRDERQNDLAGTD